jgi:hypothetical protein
MLPRQDIIYIGEVKGNKIMYVGLVGEICFADPDQRGQAVSFEPNVVLV